MKKFISLLLSLAFAGSTFAQMSGYRTSQSDGTTLGANETLTADGIALGNAVKLRGFVDFVFQYDDEASASAGQGNDAQDEAFHGGTDLDFLIDLSPVSAEIHLQAVNYGGAGVEQAFGRYDVNDVFNVSFGRQVTVLGYESDETPGLHAVTDGYVLGGHRQEYVVGDSNEVNVDDVTNTQLRKNYVDGIRLNFNNSMFGFTIGLHDSYWAEDDFNGDNVAIDLAGSVMFFPGLEARIGYAHQSLDAQSGTMTDNGNVPNNTHDGDVNQVNLWIAWNPGALTLAAEYDNFSIDAGGPGFDDDYWSFMLLANYQFTDWFAGTLRYTHEDVEEGTGVGSPDKNYDSDRFTIAALFSITEHFDLGTEFSTASIDSSSNARDIGDYNEFLVRGLITY